MPIESAALELLIALAPVASRWGRWYVFGAQAVILYGVPRLSADVDVTLAVEPDAPDRFVVDMAAAGTMLPVIDLADLIIATVLAGRPKDIDDARMLWRLHGRTVDPDRIRYTLRLLEKALAQGGRNVRAPRRPRLARASRGSCAGTPWWPPNRLDQSGAP